jgi:ribosomal protein L16/L10AE
MITNASWINDEIMEAARMQAERQVKREHERANLEEYYRNLETV